MRTPLFLLHCTEVGIVMRDLDLLSIGLVIDLRMEKANDGVKYRRVAEQMVLTISDEPSTLHIDTM